MMEKTAKEISEKRTEPLTEKECWFWLYNLEGIGKVKRRKLLEQFGTAKGVLEAGKAELSKIPELRRPDIEILADEEKKECIRREYHKMQQKGILFFVRGEEGYPERLMHIYDSPDALYVRGRFPRESKKAVAIVGARNCSDYGVEMAEYFGRELSKAGIEVISGLARGIDGASHRGVLEAYKTEYACRRGNSEHSGNRTDGRYGMPEDLGATYGVLGCGIDRCYPAENLELFMEMQERGGVISELGMGVLPRAGNFPLRNRIIGGLADGILVIEAKEKSGSLITAQLGLEQGKDIFALPGRSCDPLSRGCNNLIKQGAFLVDSPQDIMDFYEIDMKKIWKENEKNKKFLDLKWEMVYSGLSLEPKHISTIMEEAGLSLADTMEVLLSLEMRGYAKKINRNYYVLAMN